MMNNDKKDYSITVCSLSYSNYFTDADHLITGGSERQIKYVVDALVANKVEVQILLTNYEKQVAKINEHLHVKNMWGINSNLIFKFLKLSLSLITSKKYIYLRGLSWAHLYIIFISKVLNKKIVLSMTSDIQCIKTNSKLINLMRQWSLRLSSLVLSFFLSNILLLTYI